MACSQAPVGQARLRLRLLAQRLVELEIVESISHETVRQTLKNQLKPRLKESLVIAPKAGTEFAYHMKDVMNVYISAFSSPRQLIQFDSRFNCRLNLPSVANRLVFVQGRETVRLECPSRFTAL